LRSKLIKNNNQLPPKNVQNLGQFTPKSGKSMIFTCLTPNPKGEQLKIIEFR